MTVVWLGQTVQSLAVAPGISPAACTGLLEPILSGWIPSLDTSLAIAGRVFVLVSGWGVRGKMEGMGGEEGVGTGIGM